MRLATMIVAFAALAAVTGAVNARQPSEPAPKEESAPSGPFATLERRVPDLSKRLAALAPARPVEYLMLGEDVLAEASDFAHRRLARELFVLALVLDRKPPSDGAGASSAPAQSAFADQPSVGSSACLALATMAETEDDRRWLSALAATLGTDPAVDVTEVRSTVVSRDPAALELATMLGWIRAGEGRRAARLLEKPGVSALLDKCDKLLVPAIGGGSDRVRRLIDQYPYCAQCRNRRYIKGPEGVTLCPSCQGKPGVALSSREIINQLKVESMLLAGVQRSWAGQIAADDGSPLRDLDASEVALAMGVDPNKPIWRDGRWVADASAAPVKPAQAGDSAIAPVQMPGSEAVSRQPQPASRP